MWYTNFPIARYNNKAAKARDKSFSLTACNLWNALPRYTRNISGMSIDCFKKNLDKALKQYPDIPRCSAIGLYRDKHGRNSNSLCDIARNIEIKSLVNMIADLGEDDLMN